MERSRERGVLHELVAPLINGMGYQIVELTGAQRRSTLHGHLVIHKPTGINLEDCTAVYKTIYPRLEVATDAEDVHLEVGSPGVYRTIKDASEFDLFLGSKVKVMSNDDLEWVFGVINRVLDDSVVLGVEEDERAFYFERIKKAQLVYP